MHWLWLTSCTAIWIATLVLHLPQSFCGQGGGRIRIGGHWFQFGRREIERIFASLSPSELAAVLAGGSAAQETLAAAAARYLAEQARTEEDER